MLISLILIVLIVTLGSLSSLIIYYTTPLSLPLFFMVFVFISLILVIFYYNDRNFRITINFPLRYVDYSLAISAIVTLALHSINFSNQWVGIFLAGTAFASSLILPGWLIIRFLKIMRHVGLGGMLILAFLFSIGFSSLIYLSMLVINEEVTTQSLSLIYVIIGIILILVNYIPKRRNYISEYESKTTFDLLNLSTLGLITVFFVFVIFSLYPSMSSTVGIDIVRHYQLIKTLDMSPEIYKSVYPWFHFSLAAFNELTHLPMSLFQTIVSLFSIIVIYSFYLMSKVYLLDENKYAHLIGTIIFTIFSGFGWVYFLQKLPLLYGQTDMVPYYWWINNATYFDIKEGQSTELWFWFRPLTLGFTIIFVLFYFLRLKDISKKLYIPLTSFLLLILALVHLPEIIVFSIIILAIAILVPRINLRIKEISISTLVALLFYHIYFYMNQVLVTKVGVIFVQDIAIVSIFIPVITLILLKYPKRFTLSVKLNKEIIASVVLFVYFCLLIYWLNNFAAVNAEIQLILSAGNVFAVPAFMFPVFMGIWGILAIPPAIILLTSMRRNLLVVFPIFMIAVFLLGKLITFGNISIEWTGFWERRMVVYLLPSLSILSSVFLIYLIFSIKKISGISKKLRFLKPMSIGIIITFILLCGTLSTFIAINHWVLINKNLGLAAGEMNLINSVSEFVDENTTLLSMSPRSGDISQFLTSNFNTGLLKNQIWYSESPEFPLSILSGLNNSAATIFMSADDLKSPILNELKNSYVASHLLGSYSKVWNNSMLISRLPPLNPPSPNSDVVLVSSNLPNKQNYFAYDILSLGKFNYTTANLLDLPIIRNAKTIIAPNFEIANMIANSRDLYHFDFKKMIVLNLDAQDPVFEVNSESLVNVLNNSDKMRSEGNLDLDLSPFRFLTLNWYGTNSGQDYILTLNLQNGKQLSLNFKDSWNGWKEILFDINSYSERLESDSLLVNAHPIDPRSLMVSSISIETPNEDLSIPDNLVISNIGLVKNSELNSSKIISTINNKNIDLPFDVGTFPVTTDTYFDTLAEFDNGIPFIVNKTIDTSIDPYEEYHVNLYPLIKEIDSGLGQNTSSALDKALDFIDVNKGTYEFKSRDPSSFYSGNIAAFDKANFSGNIDIKANSSLIFPDHTKIEMLVDGKRYTFFNLTQIVPILINGTDIRTSSAEIDGYSGFYSSISLNNKSDLNLYGDPAILSLVDAKGEENYISGNNIQIFLNKANTISRQPTILIDGVSIFKQFYPYGHLANKVQTVSTDLVVDGKINLKILYGDKYIISNVTSLEANFRTSLPDFYTTIETITLLKWPDIGYVLLVAFILIVFNIYRSKYVKRKN